MALFGVEIDFFFSALILILVKLFVTYVLGKIHSAHFPLGPAPVVIITNRS